MSVNNEGMSNENVVQQDNQREPVEESSESPRDFGIDQMLNFICNRNDGPILFEERVERTLNFVNFVFGDHVIQHINPRILDKSRTTYVRTFAQGTIMNVKNFILTSRFINTKRVLLHVGNHELLRMQVPAHIIASRMKSTIAAVKVLIPNVEIYLSLQLPVAERSSDVEKITKLNQQYIKLQSEDFKVFLVYHDNIMFNVNACFEGFTTLNKYRGTQYFVRDVKVALKITNEHEDNLDGNQEDFQQ